MPDDRDPVESLYDIPFGCICMGDGLMGMKCEATEHAKLRRDPRIDPRPGDVLRNSDMRRCRRYKEVR